MLDFLLKLQEPIKLEAAFKKACSRLLGLVLSSFRILYVSKFICWLKLKVGVNRIYFLLRSNFDLMTAINVGDFAVSLEIPCLLACFIEIIVALLENSVVKGLQSVTYFSWIFFSLATEILTISENRCFHKLLSSWFFALCLFLRNASTGWCKVILKTEEL